MVLNEFAGQYRDYEVGLDYFGARYFSAAQGRFTSPDLANPDLSNPQTLNRYQYALNNPLRYVDRNGLYEEDVHRDLTFVLALAAGMGESVAARISAADQGVDDDPRTSPMGKSPVGEPARIRAAFHFTSEERRSELYGRFESSGSPEHLGIFLHAQQDSYSHAGYGPRAGHIIDWEEPDKTYNDPDKADRMAANTFAILARSATGVSGQRYAALGWSVVAPHVRAFNHARTPAAKRRALRQLQETVQIHHIQEERSRRRREAEQTGVCSAEFSACGGH